MAILKNTAGQNISVLAINSTTGSPVTGLSGADIVFFYSIDGATPALCGNQFTEIGASAAPGVYALPLRQLETDGDMVLVTGVPALATTSIDPTAIYTVEPPATLSNQTDILTETANIQTAVDSIEVDTTQIQADLADQDTVMEAIAIDTDELQQNQGDWLTATSVSASNAPSNWSIMSVNGSGEITTSNPASGGGSAHTAQDVRDLILGGDKSVINMTANSIDNVGTTAVNADMRGTDGANTVAPVDVSTEVNAILTLTTGTVIPNQITTSGFVTAIKAVTAKLDTTLAADGSDYQFTADALALAPTGSSGGDATAANQTTILANIATAQADIDAILIDTNDLQTSQGDWLTATSVSASNAPSNWSIMSVNGSGEITTSNPASGGGSAHTAEDVRDLILSGDKTPITTATNAVSDVVLVATTTDLTNGGGTASEANQLTIQETVDNIESKLVRRR